MSDKSPSETFQDTTDRPPDGTVKTAATCAVSGQVIEQFPDPRRVRERAPIPVRVLWAVRPWSPSITPPRDPLKRKRCYWQNGWRNTAIAAVATAFVAGDRATLLNHGLYAAKHLLRPADARPVRVAILAESPEHARVLVNLLEDWQLLHLGVSGVRPGSGGCAPGRDEAYQDGVDRAVVTFKRAQCLDRFEVDVLIRVDGSVWPLNLPGFPPARRTDDVFLIDFADFDDALALYSNERRRREYSGRGWLTTCVPTRPHPNLMGGMK
jgi:hypothetical protein